MQLYKNEKQLCFDDILLVPQSSDINSRGDISLSTSIGYEEKQIDLYLPVIAAPMDTVCEDAMSIELAKHGGIGVIHRYIDSDMQKDMVFDVAKNGFAVGAAVGTKNDFMKTVESLVLAGAKLICVDVANGHNINAINAIRKIRKSFKDLHIMAGNVSTWDAFLQLSLEGADSIRVGIGGGSMCTTRIVTGHGMPTLASIIEINDMLQRIDLPTSIVADGGIRNSGDMVKAFAAGANAVMLGSVLAGHDESPGDVMYDKNNNPYKEIRGMASRAAQESWRGSSSVVEGISTTIKYKGAVSNTLNELRGGIASGCSYSGVYHLEDLSYNAQYVTVTSNAVKENMPHGKNS